MPARVSPFRKGPLKVNKSFANELLPFGDSASDGPLEVERFAFFLVIS